ncbi:MAG: Acetyl-CoA:oxalate CoA-transferase [Acidimicrobiales bacterium]|nr:MAG: CoA transferase [Actinomycetota bacterium]MBV6507532.1 Acetyl-CoA:oxalate CoA-transferase [Acidimicrobiales bacterium]RIK07474.1 MAG: CoA transferase [Acidobacteriota bacterium]
MDRPRPLADVRVLAVEQFGAGPFGSVHLADLGAEVIKIEDPRTGGDVGRYVPPYAMGEDSLFFETFNRNKLSVSLDMASSAGRAVFEDLVRVSDAVYSNLRGDVPSALGITYSDLGHLNPMVVCCSLSGFGMNGPRRDQPGYDYVLQGMAGWMSLTGEPDGPPAKSGLSLVDYCGGFVAALALLAGLHAARRDGVGLDCDVSLFDTALSLLTYPGTWHLNEGWEAQRHRRSAHPSLSPFQIFPTSDGWIVIACPKDKFWRRLCEALGRPDLAADTRFATFEDRLVNREEVEAELDSVLATRTTQEWLAVLTGAGVPNGPVNSLAQALADPQTAARDMIVDTEHPVFGTVRQLASPVRVGEPRLVHRRAPRLHEDAAHVLGHLLGYDDTRVASLTEQGAFG